LHDLLHHLRRPHHLRLPRHHGVRLVLLSGHVHLPVRAGGDCHLPGGQFQPTRPDSSGSMTYDQASVVRTAMAMFHMSPARSVSSVARDCGVSRGTMNRAFLASAGSTARGARRRCIHVALVAQMSRVPSLSVKQVAGELGFATPQALARWTQREYGVPPTSLRTAMRWSSGDNPRALEERVVHG